MPIALALRRSLLGTHISFDVTDKQVGDVADGRAAHASDSGTGPDATTDDAGSPSLAALEEAFSVTLDEQAVDDGTADPGP